MPTIYCIPGFGVDDKIFSNLTIHNAKLVYLNWLDPQPDESIQDYAGRMAAAIREPSPVIIGISFGGMIALEMAKILHVQQLFLISSIKTKNELPRQLKMAGILRLHKIIPIGAIQRSKKFYKLANKRLGAYTEAEKAFANAYRKEADMNYINWSFDEILNWKNLNFPANTVHIHGDKDQVFPIKNVCATHIIKGGTHMMVWNRADEVSEIINENLMSGT